MSKSKDNVTFRLPYQQQGRVRKVFTGPSRTKQSHKAECDINNIMQKYLKTGLAMHVREHGGQYGNFITSDDYHEGLNKILAANAAFLQLPSAIRSKFDNEPAKFLAFVQDPANHDEMVEMGLAYAKSRSRPEDQNVEADEAETELPLEEPEGA